MTGHISRRLLLDS